MGNRSPLRVLLADDHEIMRESLRSLLSDEGDFEVVGEAANGREVVDLAGRLKPERRGHGHLHAPDRGR